MGLFSNLRFAATIDKGADWIVSSGPTDIQMSSVPWLDQTDKICTLLLKKIKTGVNYTALIFQITEIMKIIKN